MSDERERHPLDDQAGSATPSGQAPEDPGAGEPPPIEMLSAYLDNDPDLAPGQRRALEARLERDAELRASYAELDVIRQGLRELPRAAAPRSYHLTPRMLGIPEPARLLEPEPWYERHAGGLRWATSLAAILFVFVLGADVLVNTLSGPDGDGSGGADRAVTQMRSADDEAAGGGQEADDAAGGGMEPDAGGGAELAPASGLAGPTATEAAAASGESAPPASGGDAATEAAADTFSAAPTEAEAEAEEEPPATAEIAAGEQATVTGEAAREGAAVEEATAGQLEATQPEAQAFALETADADQAAVQDEDESGSLRTWRIVEFGLVAVLGVLLTATVVLPRMGRRAAR